MREKILALLRESSDYVSGEEIGGKLGISRTAVWKWLSKLMEEGYEIDGISRRGYRLISTPDKAYPWEILPKLTGDWLGRDYTYLAETNSTNQDARMKAEAQAPNGAVVVAERQCQGKGRKGRPWLSLSGGLWFSFVLRPRLLPGEAPLLTLVTAVGLVRGLKQYTGLDFGIKWPNDILWKGKKLVGILAEMKAELDGIDYVVIGIGINCAAASVHEEIADIAISLEEITGEKNMRIALFPVILKALEDTYEEFYRDGFTQLRQEWEQNAVILQRKVRIHAYEGEFDAVPLKLMADGGLLVEREDGERLVVVAGDVSLRLKENEQ